MTNLHPLREYRTKEGLTLAAFAARVGVKVPALSRIENWHRRPSWKLAGRIQQATGGTVTLNDFLQEREREAS